MGNPLFRPAPVIVHFRGGLTDKLDSGFIMGIAGDAVYDAARAVQEIITFFKEMDIIIHRRHSQILRISLAAAKAETE